MHSDGDIRRRGAAARLGLDALDHPAFRTFFGASLVSNTASFVLSAALSWSVLQATGSAASVGLVGFLYALPFALFTLHAGLLTDRFGSRRMVGGSLAAAGLVTMLMGALVLGVGLPVLAIGALAFAIGSASVLGSPGGISIVNDLVPREVVPSAVSLIFLDVNAGRIIGGLLGGTLLAIWPSGISLAVAGVMLALPAIAIWRLPIPDPAVPETAGRAMVAPLVDAARYARHQPILNTLLLLAIVPGAIGLSFNYLLPVAAKEGAYGSDGLGLMVAAAGVGGLAAALLGARLMRWVGHGRSVLLGVAMISGGLVAFGGSPTLLTCVASMILAGAGFAIYASSSLSLIQSLASTEFRGRLTAVFALLYWGLMPLGALIGGAMAEAIGAQHAMLVNGAVVGVAGVVALVARPELVALRTPATPAAAAVTADASPTDEPVREPASQAG